MRRINPYWARINKHLENFCSDNDAGKGNQYRSTLEAYNNLRDDNPLPIIKIGLGIATHVRLTCQSKNLPEKVVTLGHTTLFESAHRTTPGQVFNIKKY